jgi:predicted O-methyltransferase YrrM
LPAEVAGSGTPTSGATRRQWGRFPSRPNTLIAADADRCDGTAVGGVAGRSAITGNRQAAAWELAEGYVVEDDVLRQARARARAAGVDDGISPGAGAALRLLAAAAGAKSVAEIGTGAGISGLYLLRGMRADGVLTSVDIDSSRQALAREAFAAAGFAAGQARLIAGFAREVLPRLVDGGYDLVLCDGAAAEWAGYLAESLRLLRDGGVVVFAGVGAEVAAALRKEPGVLEAVLPVGSGLLCGVRRRT